MAELVDLLARVALNHLATPGDVQVTTAVEHEGPQAALAQLMERNDVPRPKDGEPLVVLEAAWHHLESAGDAGIRFVTPEDEEWPAALDDLRGHYRDGVGGVPVGLWVRGKARLNELVDDSVAIVGSRAATEYGFEVAAQMAGDLGRRDTTVVATSGYGIAAAAHRGALASQGHPVAITAAGVDRLYPSTHKDLLEEISGQGLVVSETPPGTAPTRMQMRASNRLVAALASATVVVEAAHRSGALDVAAWAGELGRDLHAVPGPITSVTSAGTHQLIASGRAHLIGDVAGVGRPSARAEASLDESFMPGPVTAAGREGPVSAQHHPHRAPVR